MSGQTQPADGLHACGSRRRRIDVRSSTPYHRIREILEQEGISVDCAAARMGINPGQAGVEANPACDLKLSALHRWQAALEVPIAELLTRSTPPLSPILELRARLMTALRTARSLQLQVDDEQGQALAISLARQLMDMMPELTKLSCWHASGRG